MNSEFTAEEKARLTIGILMFELSQQGQWNQAKASKNALNVTTIRELHHILGVKSHQSILERDGHCLSQLWLTPIHILGQFNDYSTAERAHRGLVLGRHLTTASRFC